MRGRVYGFFDSACGSDSKSMLNAQISTSFRPSSLAYTHWTAFIVAEEAAQLYIPMLLRQSRLTALTATANLYGYEMWGFKLQWRSYTAVRKLQDVQPAFLCSICGDGIPASGILAEVAQDPYAMR